MGESAGGHLAALLGTFPASDDSPVSSRVQAVVDFYGPTDLSSLEAVSREASGPIRQFLGGAPAALSASYEDASPIRHVTSDDPPTLIVQGSADTVVVPSQSVKFARALSRAGVRNRLIIVPGGIHGFGLRVGRRNLTSVVADFLESAMP